MSERVPEEEGQFNLKLSHEKLGPLTPIITDAYGNIIDGFHRRSVDKDWPAVKAAWITDPVQLDLARLAANFARRTTWTKDDIERLNFIAQVTGWTPREIAEKTGLAHRTVLRYLVDEFKRPYSPRGEIKEPVAAMQLKPPAERPEVDVLERASKYYPMGLLDTVWKFVTIEARRLPFAKVLIDVLWERAEEQGYADEILEEARLRFEKPEEITF